jgi:hypothetical protein
MSKPKRCGYDKKRICFVAFEVSSPLFMQRSARGMRVIENSVDNSRKPSSFGRFKHNKRGHHGSSF